MSYKNLPIQAKFVVVFFSNFLILAIAAPNAWNNRDNALLVIIWFFVICVSMIYSYHLLRKYFVIPIRVLRKAVLSIENGSDFPEIKHTSSDDLGIVGKSLISVRNQINDSASFVKSITEGNFETKLSLSEQDLADNRHVLTTALLDMSAKLKKINVEEETRKWVNEGLAHFAELMRKSENLKDLSDQLLSEMVNYLGMNQGTIFLSVRPEEGEATDENTHLEMISCYAFGRKKYIEAKIKPGDGLVGQAFLERGHLYLTEIPDDYIRITSGLGDANPKCILIVPMIDDNGIVEGIIELASFTNLKEHQIEFTKKICQNLASTIGRVRINENTKKLLELSRIQGEELRANEEEMRQNMEELQATQEEMNRRKVELEEANIELKKSEEVMRQNMEELVAAQEEMDHKQKQLTAANEAMRKNEDELRIKMEEVLAAQEEIQNAEKKAKYKSDLLRSVALSNQEFIKENDWAKAIENSFKYVGEAVKVDRVYYFKKSDASDNNQILVSQVVEWTDGKAKAEINNPDLQNVPLDIFDELKDPLLKNEVVQLKVKNIKAEALKEMLEGQEIKSLVLTPIFIEGNFEGFIGFDNCKKERTFNAEELSILETLTSTVSGNLKRKITEEAMRQTNAEMKVKQNQLDGLVNNSPGLIYRCKLDADWTMLFASEKALEISGYSAEEFLDGSIHLGDIIVKEDAARVTEEVEKGLKKSGAFNCKYRIKTKTGEIKWVWDTGTRVVIEGEEDTLEGLILDITAQKQLEETMQQQLEEIRSTEEELRQNMEELQATQEEMNRAQKELEIKEGNLNALINNTEDTIFALDKNYVITVVNDTLHNKYKSKGIVLERGVPIKDILPPDAWKVWKAKYDRGLGGEHFSEISTEAALDGSLIYRQTFHNPIRDEKGAVIGVSVMARDITDLMQAKEQALLKEDTLNSFLDKTDDTFFAIDSGYKIILANKTLKDRFANAGIDLSEGKSIFEVLPKDDQKIWKDRYDRALQGEAFSFMQERKVGDKTLQLEVSVLPIFNKKGEIIGCTVSSRDRTEFFTMKKEMEEIQKKLGQEAIKKKN
jgi:PAS domain S-box-containing protein